MEVVLARLLTTVVGLGRSFSWADFLADLDDTPLFDCGT